MTGNEFIFDFAPFIQSTFVVLWVYLVSTYLFTKDKVFFIYALFITIVLFNTIGLVPNKTSMLIYNKYKTIFDDTFWLTQLWFWMCLGWFFIEFLSIKKSKFAFIAKRYLFLNFVISTCVFSIDYFFFKATYFFNYYHNFIYLPISFAMVGYSLKEIYPSQHPLRSFFLTSLIIFVISCFQFFICIVYPDNLWTTYINTIAFFLVGLFIKVITTTVGLGYKYQQYRFERDNLNKKVVQQLRYNKELRTQSNERLHRRFKKATEELEKVAKEAENQKLIQLETQFKREVNSLKITSLLSQMNPHFIFNTLNSIKLYIIENKQKQAVYSLNKFSKFIRLVLDSSLTTETCLFQEIEAMKLYTSIENIRFNNEIQFNFVLEERLKTNDVKIPPLALHTFFENAIWHGVSSKKEEKEITTHINTQETHYLISITDNGIGREKASKIQHKKTIKRTSFGIQLTQERLENFYRNHTQKVSLKVIDLYANQESKGTRVELKIPKA